MTNERKLLIAGVVLILIILGALVWYMSSHPAPEPTPLPPVSGPQVGQKETITDNGDYHEIEASYPATTPLRGRAGAEADAQAVAAMKNFEVATIATFKSDSGLEVLTPEDIEMFGLDQGRKYTLDIDYKLYTSDETVSYVFTIYEDTLGAHPNGYYRTFTFDAQTGAGLQISSLFEAEFLTFLSERSREELVHDLALDMQVDEDQVDRSMLDSGTTPDEDNFQNFYLTDTELVIIFPPYQVAPYVAGTREVRIPKSELSGMLKARYR